MHARLFILIKTLIKSSLDNYILPGTLTGSEILWLYLGQWKREAASIVLASNLLFVHNFKLRSILPLMGPEKAETGDAQLPIERS